MKMRNWMWMPVFATAAGTTACSKDGEKSGDADVQSDVKAAAPGETGKSTAAKETGEPSVASGEAGPSGDAKPEAEAAVADSPSMELACDQEAQWQKVEMKHLKTGSISSTVDEVKLPSTRWKACDSGKPGCEKLELADGEELLGIGSQGNTIRLLTARSCGEGSMAIVYPLQGDATAALRGDDIVFESAKLGGDRFLIGATAKHRSEKARQGWTPREYLITGRQGQFAKLEPARNKLKSVPLAAASQIVQVETEGGTCTTMFWKLGVSQCDFETPGRLESVMLGANMIYRDPGSGKGMAWSSKDGSRELLPRLDWIVSDGVNVAWAADGRVRTAQPNWKLEKLEAKPVSGPAGPKPVALGCGRTLAKTEEGWMLRNLKMGSYWMLDADRFPDERGEQAVMDCDWVVFESGYRVSLKSAGKLTSFPDEEQENASGPKDAPASDAPQPKETSTEPEKAKDAAAPDPGK